MAAKRKIWGFGRLPAEKRSERANLLLVERHSTLEILGDYATQESKHFRLKVPSGYLLDYESHNSKQPENDID